MKYFDKSKNRDIALAENKDEKLVILSSDDAENLAIPGILLSGGGTIVPVSPRALRVRMPGDAENVAAMNRGMETLAEQEGVEMVASLARDEGGSEVFVVPNRISVLARGLTKAKAAKTFKDLGFKLEDAGRSRGLYVVSIPKDTDLGAAIEAINQVPEVMLAEPVFIGIEDQELTFAVRISRSPASDAEGVGEAVAGADCPLEWNHDRIRILTAWARTRGSEKVVIGVVDGRPELEHEALAGRLIADFSDEMRFSEQGGTSSHATNVASIALGGSDCFSGVAPECRLLPLVVDLTVQEYWRRADAIFYAAERARAKTVKGAGFERMVLVCSWKMASDISVVRLALTEAVEAGVLVVTSAGNANTDAPHWPSDYSATDAVLSKGLLSVAATDEHDARSFYSNWSGKVDLAAPGGDGPPFDGGDLLCAGLGGTYDRQAGTSLSAPQVAGVAALALSVDPTLTVDALKRLLRETTDEIATDRHIGTGRLNAGRLFDRLGPPGDGPPPPAEPDVPVPETPQAEDGPVPVLPPEENPQEPDDGPPVPPGEDGPTIVITVDDSGETLLDLRSLAEDLRDRTEAGTDGKAELRRVVFRTAAGDSAIVFDE